jgi:hypothetical protein
MHLARSGCDSLLFITDVDASYLSPCELADILLFVRHEFVSVLRDMKVRYRVYEIQQVGSIASSTSSGPVSFKIFLILSLKPIKDTNITTSCDID